MANMIYRQKQEKTPLSMAENLPLNMGLNKANNCDIGMSPIRNVLHIGQVQKTQVGINLEPTCMRDILLVKSTP